MDIKERFSSKVKVQESGCHEWQSTLHRGGYGKFWFNGDQIQAHRMAWLLYRGEIPEAQWVLHHCDNRKCVNPEHLYLGDAKQNSSDRTKRLRYGCRKLSTESVEMIRRLHSLGFNQTELGKMFGVYQSHISSIVRMKQRILK